MKRLLSTLCLMSLALLNWAQHETCAHDIVLQRMAEKSPQFMGAMQAQLAHSVKGARAAQNKSNTVYQIPVVFHVVYNTPEQNLPDEVFENQIEILTQDYRRLNSNASETRAIFANVAADAEIEFVLASTDPQGNPTNGIVRVETEETGFDLDLFSTDITLDEVKFTESGGADSWGNEYLNIWVCNIEDTGFGQILGFAYPPNGAANWEGFFDFIDEDVDGVVVHYTAVGSNNPQADDDGVAFNNGGRTLTHEVGHFLGLRHIWGDAFFNGCTTDDGIADTPDAANGANYNCDFSLDECTDDELPNMIENYMDYNQDDCINMFTAEQVAVMRFNLENLRPELIDGQFVNVNETVSIQNELNLFPNPARSFLRISSNINLKSQTYMIRDLSGRTIAQGNFDSSQAEVPLNLRAGYYVLELTEVKMRKAFIVE